MTERFEVQRTIPFDAATIFGVAVRPAGPRRHRRVRHAAELPPASRPVPRATPS